MNEQKSSGRVVVVVHPSPDMYGPDLQMAQTVAGLKAAWWRVVGRTPAGGPLVERLTEPAVR
jgi:hypothetical protein